MLVKCETCGKFFGTDNSDQKQCSACSVTGERLARHVAESGDPKFVMAREIVYDQPEISPEDLKKAMAEIGVDISVREIMGYVKEGRLSMVNNPGAVLCEECGRPIMSGRLCPKCSSNLEKAITQRNEPRAVTTKEVKGGQEKQGITMHTKQGKKD